MTPSTNRGFPRLDVSWNDSDEEMDIKSDEIQTDTLSEITIEESEDII